MIRHALLLACLLVGPLTALAQPAGDAPGARRSAADNFATASDELAALIDNLRPLRKQPASEIVMKDTYELGEPITAGCQCLPDTETSEVEVTWRHDAATTMLAPSEDVRIRYCWAAPGKHWVEAQVVTRTFTLMSVFVPGPGYDQENPKLEDLVPKTLRMPVGMTLETQRHEYTVAGSGPGPEPPGPDPPGPDPPTPTPGLRHIVVVEESGDRTPQQSVLYLGAQANSGKNTVRVVDKDQGDDTTQPLINKVRTDKLAMPHLFIMDATGKVLHSGPLPATYDAYAEALTATGG